MKKKPDAGARPAGPDEWHKCLGWAYGLVASDPAARAAALSHLAEAQRNTQTAIDLLNESWQRMWPSRAWTKAAWKYCVVRQHSLPDALWDRPTDADITKWPGLPFALLFLEWEAKCPQEWTRHAKAWGTKQSLLRDLAVDNHSEPVKAKLSELLDLVVQRPYRCKDREYVRICRVMDGNDLRARLTSAAESDNPWPQRHAGYILWLLDRPEVPNTRHVWRTWLAEHHDGDVRAR
ncbi:hypothetical protein ACO0M4_12580 [Streptomyces sp. RGM 3693]|uniref:hypothetical protein n=1 Tax=Streptomyces sp. RGM 3693 TaxID=3413284 RepID=UPI003D28C145